MSRFARRLATLIPLGALLPAGTAWAADELTRQSIEKFLLGIASLALRFVLVVAAIFLILAGYQFMTSFGNQGKLTQAKNSLLFVVIGVLVVLGAYLAVNTLLAQLSR